MNVPSHIILILLTVLTANILACGQSTSQLEPVTVAAYAGDVGTLVFLAQEQGYFADNGLEVTIREYEAGKLAADALLAGEVDIATAADFVLVSNSFDNDDLRVLSNYLKTVRRQTRRYHSSPQASCKRPRKLDAFLS